MPDTMPRPTGTAISERPRADRDDIERARHSPGAQADGSPAAAIHSRVLSAVASRICRCEDPRGDDGDCLSILTEALLESEDAFDRALARAQAQHGLSDEELVDCYIPAIACRLGSDWVGNDRSFAEVTIGTARLIATVRRISRRWAADRVADWNAPAMAMVVPEAEQHRLGAMIAASRFRRMGVSVQLMLGRTDEEVLGRVRDGGFDLLSFSLATRERVEQTRRLIQMLRDRVSVLPPIVVGGAIGVGADELKTQLGADHVVSDPVEALRLCGVTIPRSKRGAATPRALA